MDTVLRALADPIRRDILWLVDETELTVGAIADRLPISRPGVSQHLRVLEDAELVTVRAEGTRRLYRSRRERIDEVRDFLDGFWDLGLASLKHAAESAEKEPRP